MCGVAGFITLDDSEIPKFRGGLRSALERLRHRGPDGANTWSKNLALGEVSLGHTRLSIIDLSPGGQQPMVTHDGSHVLSYNGEIYNFVEIRSKLSTLGVDFESQSDTEVLLLAWKTWGPNALDMLNGMFAFAVFDVDNQTMTLARDRYGMKPLFYSQVGNSLVFASEAPVVASFLDKNEPNHQKAYEYLTMGLYDSSEETFFQGVYSLEPGSILQVEAVNGAFSVNHQRWARDIPPEPIEVSLAEAVGGVRERFLESIELHLRSDVPIALALSGGLDSSGIVSALKKLDSDRPIHTFSFSSPGAGKDETEWAKLASDAFGTIHQTVVVNPERASSTLKEVVIQQGEPTNSSSVIAQSALYQEVSGQGFRVMLDGQGADEVFAGYKGFPEFRVRSLLADGDLAGAISLIWKWQKFSADHTLSNFFPMFGATLAPHRLAHLGAWVVGRSPTPRWLRVKPSRVLGLDLSIPSVVGYPVMNAPQNRFLQQHLFQSVMGGDLRRLLRHGDRSSMAHSVESRLPYLGNNLVDYVQRLPESFLLGKDGATKGILRKALSGLVPEQVVSRRDKVGFETPQSKWMGHLERQGASRLGGLSAFEWIDRRALEETLLVKRNRGLDSDLYWRALNLSMWAENLL